MREVEIGDGELARILSSVKWELLREKKPEFIISILVKKFRSEKLKFVQEKDNKTIVVVPVTQFDVTNPVARESPFVYEFYRDWSGEVLKEWNDGSVDQCRVKIRKSKTANPVVTVILKSDLSYE